MAANCIVPGDTAIRKEEFSLTRAGREVIIWKVSSLFERTACRD